MFGPPKTNLKKQNPTFLQNQNLFASLNQPIKFNRLQKMQKPFNNQLKQLQKTTKRQVIAPNRSKPKPNVQIKLLPKSSGIDKYIAKPPSNNNINFKSLKSGMKLAPSNQFSKYLDDKNVFYQDSKNVKNLKRIKIAKIYLLCILFILMSLYFLVGRIRPYPKGQCPSHANCQVFIHCHKGYINVQDKCQIDPMIIDQAQQISYAVLEQLSLDLGNKECLPLPINSTVQKKITQVFKQFSIQDDLLKDQIANYFQNRQYQKQLNFAYRINTIIPNDKKYSFSCQMQLFYSTPAFKYVLILLIFLALLAIFFVRSYLQDKKANLIYKDLKRCTQHKGSIEIDVYKKLIEIKYGKWDQNIWILVDKKRSEDLQIVYYIDQQHLYWKKVE